MNRGRTQKFFNQREITAKAMRSLVEARCVFLSHEDIRVRLSVALVVQPLCLCCKDREHIFRFDGQHVVLTSSERALDTPRWTFHISCQVGFSLWQARPTLRLPCEFPSHATLLRAPSLRARRNWCSWVATVTTSEWAR